MTILDKIIAHKRVEVARAEELYPPKLLEQSIFFNSAVVSLREYLSREDRLGVIAEIKRRSPSKGDINPYICVEELSIGYMQAGASALSVLTDTDFFGGSHEDLKIARRFNFCPILRKDFIIDEYQLLESKAMGADVILLIAHALRPDVVKNLTAFAKTLGLEVLLEVQADSELETHWCPDIDIVGVNNRNLDDFTVSVERSLKMADRIPGESIKISESGLNDPQTILTLKEAGYNGFLIGEAFMAHSRPQEACQRFIKSVYALEQKGSGY